MRAEFAVVDVETTGLFPGGSDRVIEIAVVRLDPSGETLGEYASLINPHRDLGPTHVHGIKARDVLHAPSFEEVAGDILDLLAGAVFVAHNVSFDLRFVRAEMERSGYELPEVPCLCTMRLARQVDPHVPSRQLSDLCAHFGIEAACSHSAYDDACAAGALMATCIAKLGMSSEVDPATIGVSGKPVGRDCWPAAVPSGRAYPRTQAAREEAQTPSYIARLVSKLPASSVSEPAIDEYCALLDRVLEDRRVTPEELQALRLLADDLGLSRRQAREAHRAYMRDLIRVALADEVITESEQKDLDEVRELLGISANDYELLLTEVMRKSGDRRTVSPATQEVAGKTVCFTGTLTCRVGDELVTRSFAESAATECGMIVKRGVTKKLDFLVVADPDSMSGKARKARDYGVRILAEPVFWRMVGVDVE